MICSCPSFLQSHFLICKHLVQTINGRHKRLLYNEFQRNCTYPFWEFNSNSNIINTENANTDVSINDNVINNNIVNKIMILRTYYQKNYGLKFKNLFIYGGV